MSNTLRLVFAIIGAALLAALATPELAGKLPPGTSQVLAAVIATALHKINATASPSEPTPPEAP